MQLYKTIQNKSKIHCGFCMRHCDFIAFPQASQFKCCLAANSGREKPRYITIAFQTDRDNDKIHNASVFDHCSVVHFNAGFSQNKVAIVFKKAVDFRKKFYNIDTLLSNGGVNPSGFIDL